MVPVGIQLTTIPDVKGNKELITKLYTPTTGEEEWNAAKIVFNSVDSGHH